MTFDAKTIATIITALGLAWGQFHQTQNVAVEREDVATGVVGYVDPQIEELRGKIAEQGIEIRVLKAEVEGAVRRR